MIVLPLGLGTKLKRPAWVSIVLCLVWIAAYVVDRSDDRIFTGIFDAVSETGVRDRARDLFVDYCRSRRGSVAECRKYAVLVWTGYPAKDELKGGADPTEDERFTTRVLAEQTIAERLKKGLRRCDVDPRCFAYKDIVWRFLDQSHQRYKVFADLASYAPYASAVKTYRKRLAKVCAANDCLVQSNITAASLAAAQLRHGSFTHLAGNLIMFLIFGIYAEQRTHRLVYLLTVVVGGTIGMAVHAAFFSSGDTLALGGSANVSAAMGLFFGFFFRQNMRFLVWIPIRRHFFGRPFPAPVALAFPLVFILSDVIGGFSSGFNDLSTGSVAHFAHLSGFAFGAAVAFVITSLRPLPLPFIYEDELADMKALESQRDPAAALHKASDMIRYNPDNVHALEVGASLFLRWAGGAPPNDNAALFDQGRRFLIDHMPTVCAVNVRKNELRYACRLLSQMPMYMPYPVYLERLGQVPSLCLADYALIQGHPILSLRLYDFFLSVYGRSTKRGAIESTCLQALACLPPSAENVRALELFSTYHPASALNPWIAAWVREKVAA